MDKRTLAAVALSIAVWLGWMKFYAEPHHQAQRQWQEHQKSLAQAEAEKAAAAMKTAEAAPSLQKNLVAAGSPRKPEIKKQEQAIIETSRDVGGMNVRFSSGLNPLSGWVLPNYLTSNEKESDRRKIDLVWVTGYDTQAGLSSSSPALEEHFAQAFQPQAVSGENQLYRDRLATDQVRVERTWSKGATANTLTVNYSVEFQGEVPKYVHVNLWGNPKRVNDTEGSIFGEYPDKVEFTYWNREGRHSTMAANLTEPVESLSGNQWLSLNTRYFLFALIPATKDLGEKAGVQISRSRLNGADAVNGRYIFPTDGQRRVEIPLTVYFGPKQLETLEVIAPTVSQAIDFGSMSFIAVPLLKMLKWVYAYVGNYGIAIVIVTLFVKILLFPLTYKSMKSMAKLAKLRPDLERIQKKYADDKQKQQQEIWNLYKTNGANPISGCLPILLQMPVFFALYRVLFNCMELYQAPFYFWIHDLSARDPWFVTPVILIVLMYFQQLLTPTTNVDPSQQAALRLMPVIFGVFMLFLPAGLNVYMIVNTVVSVAQQYVLNKRFGVGNFAPKSEPTIVAAVKSTS